MRIQSQSGALYFILGLLLVVTFLPSTIAGFFSFRNKNKQYTPLVFFKLPLGSIPECDEMEKVVREVERELGVRVERLDVARDPAAETCLALLTQQHSPPFLYHRESLQTIFIRDLDNDVTRKQKSSSEDSSGGDSKSPLRVPVIDKDRVRAWAKGRYLPPPGVNFGMQSRKKGPVFVSKEDNALDQQELLDIIKEETMTPEQLEGKRAMEARTAERAQNTSK